MMKTFKVTITATGTVSVKALDHDRDGREQLHEEWIENYVFDKELAIHQ